MKVIDLLNKIANDEEIPRKIKVNNTNVIYKYDGTDYKNKNDKYLFDTYVCINNKDMNMEVEIIEDTPKDKKIPEKLEILPDNVHYSNRILYGKINEIIDYLDYLKSKGE